MKHGKWTEWVVVLQTVLILVMIVQLNGLNDKFGQILSGVEEAEAQVGARPEAPTPIVEVSVDDDSVKGDPNAPVTIIEFSDFECPFCGQYFTQTYPQIIQNYVDTGKVKMVFRDFPLSFHPNAQKAAEAAECAGEQGKFWEMHDIIFENQQSLSIDNYKTWAGQLGLDQASFDSCLDNGDMASEVQKDFTDGQSYGVRGTPAFFVNGKMISGAQPYERFKQIIDAELEG